MIEFIQQEKSNTYHLFHNGKKIKDVLIEFQQSVGDSERNFVITATNRKSGEKLISLIDTETDFPEYDRLAIHNWDSEVEIDFRRLFFYSKSNDFVFDILLEDFDSDESEIESLSFITGLKVNELTISASGYHTDENGKERINLEFEFEREEGKSSLESILKNQKQIRSYCESAIDKFVKKDESDVLFTIFNFPEELKVPCEQYLWYFAQFLQDLGINATPNIKEEAGKVLFSITPTDDIEALDKIREALGIYLSLSSNPIANSTGDRTVDMVLSGARANAKHLESQLELAIAKLQFKEATLELKDATIEQHQLALRRKDETIKELQEIVARGNIFQESLERVEINGEIVDESSLYRFSREDVFEVEATTILDEKTEETRIGLVKFHEVTKLKDYGVSLDLPKAIKDLIDFFKRDKSK